jgi:hypothetical protein
MKLIIKKARMRRQEIAPPVRVGWATGKTLSRNAATPPVSRLRRSGIGRNATPPSRVGLLPVGASAPVRGNLSLLPEQFSKAITERKEMESIF